MKKRQSLEEKLDRLKALEEGPLDDTVRKATHDALADRSNLHRGARCAAAHLLGETGTESAQLLLHMKINTGDAEPEVIGECCTALLRFGGERPLDLVARHLRHPLDEVAQEAALALGSLQDRAAFDALRAAREDTITSPRRMNLLLPMALTRCDEAYEYLLHVVRTENPAAAESALDALRILAADDRRRTEILDAVNGAGDKSLKSAYHKIFADIG